MTDFDPRCYRCGNGPPGLTRQDGIIEHKEDDAAQAAVWEAVIAKEARDNPEWQPEWAEEFRNGNMGECGYDPCPPIADGLGRCHICEHAVPLAELRQMERLTVYLLDLDAPNDLERATSTPDIRFRPVTDEPEWGRPYGLGHVVRISREADPPWASGSPYDPRDDGPILECQSTVACKERYRTWRASFKLAEIRGKAEYAATHPKIVARKRPSPATVAPLDKVPEDGSGLTIAQLMKVWKMRERQTREEVRRLVESKELRVGERPSGHGSPTKLYWRSKGAQDETA